jgi:homoaconitate hydratase
MEEGNAFPYTLTVASDSHNLVALDASGRLVRIDAAAICAIGKTWWQVPRMVKVEPRGRLPVGVTGKDVVVVLCGVFDKAECSIHRKSVSGFSIFAFLSMHGSSQTLPTEI